MKQRLIVNISAFAKMVCGNGHIDPSLLTGAACKTCKSKKRKPSVTIRLMCRQGRIPGAIFPGGEWLIDVQTAISGKIGWKGRGRPPIYATENTSY